MSFDIGKTVVCDHVDYTGKSWKDPSIVTGCPKCLGLGTYYDFEWNEADGSVKEVTGLSLLQELTLKAVLTLKESNKFHPEYGTGISDSVAAIITEESIRRMVEYEVGAALGQLHIRQQMQQQLGQEMSDDELIYEVADLVLRFVDERTITIYISIVTESGRTVTFQV